MTIFSFILVLYLSYLSINIKNKETFFVKIITLYFIFHIFINIGYFIRINEYLVNYFDVIFIYMVLMSYVFFGNKIKIKKKLLVSVILFISIVFFGIFLLVFWPPKFKVVPTYFGVAKNIEVYPTLNFQVIKRFGLIVLFSLFILVFKDLINEKLYKRVIDNLIQFGKIYIYFCLFEFIYITMFNSDKIYIVLKYIFGRNVSQHIELFMRGGRYTLRGLTREPSHLAIAIFVFIFILLLSNRKEVEKIFYLILSIFLLFISGSASGFSIIFILIFTFLLTVSNLKKIFVYGCTASGLAIFIMRNVDFSYYLYRINLVLDNKEPRFLTIINSFQDFLKSPLMGVGIGTTMSYGFISSTLSNIGLIGFLAWGYIIFYGTKIVNLKHAIILLMVFVFFTTRGSIQDLYSGTFLIFIYSLYYFFTKEDFNSNHIESNMELGNISKN